MRAQEELEEPQEAMSATAFPKELESQFRNRPRPSPVLRGRIQARPLSEPSSPSAPWRLALTRTTITEVPSQVALGAAEWKPVQPSAEVVNSLRRWQERSRALLGSTEHGRRVRLQQQKAAE